MMFRQNCTTDLLQETFPLQKFRIAVKLSSDKMTNMILFMDGDYM